MRRLIPWALLVLLGVGAGLGAALGAAGSPTAAGPSPQQWVDGVWAKTKAAGTAHLDYAAVTTSPNPVLRGSAAGTGVVDFAAGSFRISEVQHQDDWTTGPGGRIQPHAETFAQAAIAVGPDVYLDLGPTTTAGWAKESIPRNRSGLGLSAAAGFSDALSWLGSPFRVLRVRALGTARVEGEETTRYVVRSQLQVDCPKGTSRPGLALESTTLWIDGQGRLVQARNAAYSSGKLPAAIVRANPIWADRPMGSTTQHTTLRLSAFGAPVHVAPPAATVDQSSASVAELRACDP